MRRVLRRALPFLRTVALRSFQIEHPTQERIVGSIYKGRIQNLEHDLQAAFVDIGLKKNAFLHYWDMIPDDEARLDFEEGGRRGGRTPRKRRYSNTEIERRFRRAPRSWCRSPRGRSARKGRAYAGDAERTGQVSRNDAGHDAERSFPEDR